MEELKVGKIIISKQKEDSNNFKKFVQVARNKNIEINLVKAGDKVNFEKDLYMNILWPQEEQISDNPLNNNSIVGKLVYKNFSMLFTGDIEEIAEKSILDKYANKENILYATVLKVAHHGSKTSSTGEFLKFVKPKIALIGVGENNNFGHPSDVTLKSLEDINCKIYRTDESGEITVIINKKGKVLINKMLN